jgi:hypothetical protein
MPISLRVAAPRRTFMGMSPLVIAASVAASSLSLPSRSASAADDKNPVYTDPAKVDRDYAIQGEYAGSIDVNGQPTPVAARVIALGNGTFDVVAYPGGLPGLGWTGNDRFNGSAARKGEAADAPVKIEGTDWTGSPRTGVIKDGAIVVFHDDGTEWTRLPKKLRTSATLGQKPPEGAVVIFDGPGPVNEADTLVDPHVTDDGLLMQGVTTKETFGDAVWHIEFRLPYQPFDRGQNRGNSGAYVQGCYEVQMLDSFGLEGKDNECGGLYSIAAPLANAALPPLEWQTYDIDFTAPKFADGKKVSNARMTVRHNGILVQDDVEVPVITPAGPQPEERPQGPLHLQEHGCRVRYRNIWVRPKS